MAKYSSAARPLTRHRVWGQVLVSLCFVISRVKDGNGDADDDDDDGQDDGDDNDGNGDVDGEGDGDDE